MSSFHRLQQHFDYIDSTPEHIVFVCKDTGVKGGGIMHRHRKGQLIYPQSAPYRVRFKDGIWYGGRYLAIWIPPGIWHTVESANNVWVRNVYIDTQQVVQMPETVSVVQVSVLLDTLLAQAEQWQHDTHCCAEYHRLWPVIIDQLRYAAVVNEFYLPISQHSKLKHVIEQMQATPDINIGLDELADKVHISTRTLARLFISELGLNFSSWRQRLIVMEAIARLSSGQSVIRVATDLGYTSQSAFTAMFRRVTGKCPALFKRHKE